MPIQASSKSTEHKKPRHPVGVFRVWLQGITPVVPNHPCADLSYSCCLELSALYDFIIRNNALIS